MTTADYEYDSQGRLQYHPEIHFRHGKTFTEEETEYMCKFWEFDGYRKISFALGRTEKTVAQKMVNLKKAGLYEYYKNLNKHW